MAIAALALATLPAATQADRTSRGASPLSTERAGNMKAVGEISEDPDV